MGALAQKVDPGIVDITSQLGYSQATAEGTGMVLSSDGLVLTNNHVIDEATKVTGTLVDSGKTYAVKVLGYDSTDDVALLQLQNASGLHTVSLSDSAKAKVGDAVLALGNAGGRGGLPSTAQGLIQGLNQSIKASDSGAGTTEALHGMIETDAPIQPGDSGGPLVNGDGAVVGMDTAAHSDSFGSASATTGFAIPINNAMSIANQIKTGTESSKIHIGLAGFIGVSDPTGGCGTSKSGALICQVVQGAPAATAGLAQGDVITTINGKAISSFDGLTDVMTDTHPGTKLSVVYIDQSGTHHTTTITLTGWAR